MLRWLLDGTRAVQLAVDNQVSRSTGYVYLHEGITVLAAHAPSPYSVLLAAKMASYTHVTIDGALIETDRCRTPGVDLWWSGKHDNHGGNVQVITAPDGSPLWTSPVRPGREHDTTALREHGEILPLFTAWIDDHLRVLVDLSYEGRLTGGDQCRGLRVRAGSTRSMPMVIFARNSSRVLASCLMPFAVLSRVRATSAAISPRSAGGPAVRASVTILANRLGYFVAIGPSRPGLFSIKMATSLVIGPT